MPGGPVLSVVIPTRDRREALAETLDAVEAQAVEPGSVEVIVVDNGSSDGTPGWLATREVKVVAQPKPGPAAARNRGVAESAGEVVLFLGDDTRPADEHVLAGHIARHRDNPDRTYGVLGRVRWRPDKPVTPFMHWLEHGGPQFDFDGLSPGPVPTARHLYTAHVSLKRAVLRDTGGFDERFPYAAVEDIELGLRLERAGVVLHYDPALIVEHDHPYEPRGLAGRQARVGASARLMEETVGTHGLLPTPRWTWALHRAAEPLLAAAARAPLPRRGRERVWEALAMAGYARGWAKGVR